MKKPRPKKCKYCKNQFLPYTSLQQVCSIQCSIEYGNIKAKRKAKKEYLEKKRRWKEENMTRQDWIKELQRVFYQFIRLRDKNKGCVSCGATLVSRKYDAGHFYPTTYSGLRFNEKNVHGQCVPCNRYKHSNPHEYRKRITNRISKEDLQWLDDNRHRKLSLSITEIKELIKHYKLRVKHHANK